MASRIDPNSLAIDGNALSGLKRAAQQESPEAIKAAAKQFEAVLMNMMLKSMRDTVPQDGPLDNEQSKMFMGMLDQQLSTHLAQKGLGLADVLAKQLSKQPAVPLAANGEPSHPAASNGSSDAPSPATPAPAKQSANPLTPASANLAAAAASLNANSVNATGVNGTGENATAAQRLAQLLASATTSQGSLLASTGEDGAGVNAFIDQLQRLRADMRGDVPLTSRTLSAGQYSADASTTTPMPLVNDALQAGRPDIAQKMVQAYQTLATFQAEFSAAAPMVFPALSPQAFSQAFVKSASKLAAGAASHTQQFIQRLLPHAEAASAMSGIPAKFMVGQAALETGWGKHHITTADGQPSHNFFGIKADARWTGKVALSTTTEYIQGVKQTRVEKFRAYDSEAEAFQDYAKLISQQPRYQQAMQNTHDAAAYAHALQRAGYATDPHYGQKLAALIERIRT